MAIGKLLSIFRYDFWRLWLKRGQSNLKSRMRNSHSSGSCNTGYCSIVKCFGVGHRLQLVDGLAGYTTNMWSFLSMLLLLAACRCCALLFWLVCRENIDRRLVCFVCTNNVSILLAFCCHSVQYINESYYYAIERFILQLRTSCKSSCCSSCWPETSFVYDSNDTNYTFLHKLRYFVIN